MKRGLLLFSAVYYIILIQIDRYQNSHRVEAMKLWLQRSACFHDTSLLILIPIPQMLTLKSFCWSHDQTILGSRNTDNWKALKLYLKVSNVTHELAKNLGVTFCRATAKHAQAICLIERMHARIKTSSKLCLGEFRQHWHNYLSLGVANYNTTEPTSMECQPSWKFLHLVPHNLFKAN